MWLWMFIASSFINIIALFYIRWLIKTIAVINEDMDNIMGLISEFAAHTKSVHELEMFYGDQTLESLMKHANELAEKLSDLDLVLNEEDGEELGTTEED